MGAMFNKKHLCSLPVEVKEQGRGGGIMSTAVWDFEEK